MSKNKFAIFALILIAIVCLAGIIFIQQIKIFGNTTIKPATEALINPQLVYIPIDVNDPSYGNPGAQAVFVFFGDLGCKKCSVIYAQLREFARANTSKVKIIWKNAPTSGWLSEGSASAHRAAMCAFKQNKFWEFTDMAYTDKQTLTSAELLKIADGLKLNLTQFNTCIASDETKQKVETDLALAQALGVNELPGVFVNNRQINIPDDINFPELLNKFLSE